MIYYFSMAFNSSRRIQNVNRKFLKRMLPNFGAKPLPREGILHLIKLALNLLVFFFIEVALNFWADFLRRLFSVFG